MSWLRTPRNPQRVSGIYNERMDGFAANMGRFYNTYCDMIYTMTILSKIYIYLYYYHHKYICCACFYIMIITWLSFISFVSFFFQLIMLDINWVKIWFGNYSVFLPSYLVKPINNIIHRGSSILYSLSCLFWKWDLYVYHYLSLLYCCFVSFMSQAILEAF